MARVFFTCARTSQCRTQWIANRPPKTKPDQGSDARLAAMFTANSLTGSKPEQYAQLLEQARGLMFGEADRIANAANLAALVYHALPDLAFRGRGAVAAQRPVARRAGHRQPIAGPFRCR